MTTRDAIQKCIELAGGATELARRVGVAYKTVQDWKSGRSGISQSNCIKLEEAVEGKITREEILPSYNWNSFKSMEKKEVEIAKSLLASKVDKNAISKATGLSVEEIEKLED